MTTRMSCLDHQHGSGPRSFPHVTDERRETPPTLAGFHAGRRLVEQQQPAASVARRTGHLEAAAGRRTAGFFAGGPATWRRQARCSRGAPWPRLSRRAFLLFAPGRRASG